MKIIMRNMKKTMKIMKIAIISVESGMRRVLEFISGDLN